MDSKANTRYQGRNKGSNKHFFETRRRQLDTVLLVVRNQTRARVAFTLTDVRPIYPSLLFVASIRFAAIVIAISHLINVFLYIHAQINHAIATAGRMYRVSEAMEIFQSLPQLGAYPQINQTIYHHNIYCLFALLKYLLGYFFVLFLGFKADLMSYNNIIWAAGNTGNLDLAENIFSGLRFNQQLRPNAYTFGSLMHGCAKAKAVDRALAYLDEMDALGITPNQIVFTSAMEACAEKHKQALAVMHRIEAVGLKPDLTMVNSAIKACCLAGAMEEAEALAEGLRLDGSMDLFTYHTLMMGHTKLGAYHKVMLLYEQAIESNTQLDGGVYSLAMLSALNCGSFNTVKQIADKAHLEQVELTEASYTILIQALAELNDFEAAVKCLDDMAAEGLRPNAITYSAVIAASKDHPQVVMQLLDRMERENVTKNTVVLTAAINSLARSGEAYVNSALAILESMEARGPEPNIYTYNTITRALAESGLLGEALALVERVRSKGLKPDRFTLTTLLIACGRTKSSEMVPRVIETMALAGVPPDGIAFGAALDAHRRAENALGAVECLSQMAKYRVEPTASHYNLVIRSLKAQGFTDRMFKMVIGISQKETAKSKINSNTFEIVIESMLAADKWKEAMILVQTMEKLDFKPSVQICVALVEKLERARQYKSVMAMYKLMVRYEYDFYENGVLNLIFKRMITVATMDLDMKLGLQDIFQKLNARK